MRKTTGSRRKDLMLDSSRGSALLRGVDLSGAKIGSTLRIRLSHDYQVVPRTMLRLYEEPIIPPLMNAWDRFHLEGTVLFPTRRPVMTPAWAWDRRIWERCACKDRSNG